MTEELFDMSVAVNGGKKEQILKIPDTISSFYGNRDGFTLCGTRTYSLTKNYESRLVFSGGDKLTLTSSKEDDVPVKWYPELTI